MNKKLLKLIIKYLNKPKFLFGLGLSFIGTIMSLFIPQFMGNLLNEEFLTRLFLVMYSQKIGQGTSPTYF